MHPLQEAVGGSSKIGSGSHLTYLDRDLKWNWCRVQLKTRNTPCHPSSSHRFHFFLMRDNILVVRRIQRQVLVHVQLLKLAAIACFKQLLRRVRRTRTLLGR